jgi:hypothetical protein
MFAIRCCEDAVAPDFRVIAVRLAAFYFFETADDVRRRILFSKWS